MSQFKFENMVSYFDYADHEIRVEVSPINGKEAVYLDDQLQTEVRNLWKFSARHPLLIDGEMLEVEIIVRSMLRGKIDIYLKKAGVALDSDHWNYQRIMQQYEGRPAHATKQSLIWSMLVGMAVGFAVVSLLTMWLKG